MFVSLSRTKVTSLEDSDEARCDQVADSNVKNTRNCIGNDRQECVGLGEYSAWLSQERRNPVVEAVNMNVNDFASDLVTE